MGEYIAKRKGENVLELNELFKENVKKRVKE